MFVRLDQCMHGLRPLNGHYLSSCLRILNTLLVYYNKAPCEAVVTLFIISLYYTSSISVRFKNYGQLICSLFSLIAL